MCAARLDITASIRSTAVLVAACLALAACSGKGSSNAADDAGLGGSALCSVTAPTECPDPMPRYADVAPIVQEHCVVCHSGVDNIWPLTDYDHIVTWMDDLRSDMLTCSMPPLDAGVNITVEERMVILRWIRCGMPQ